MSSVIEEEAVFVLKEIPAGGSNLKDLNELLAEGWYVKSVSPMGMSSGINPHIMGMAVVVLRKPR